MTADAASRAESLELFVSTDVIAALVVLILNDRLAKDWWPGVITGKLSDLAGLYLFPLVLVGVVEFGARWLHRAPPSRRSSLAVAVATTVVVFSAIKLNGPVGDAYRTGFGLLRWPLSALESWLGGEGFEASMRVTLVADATDLVALPAAGLVWWVHGRLHPRTQVSGDGPGGDRRR